MRQRVYISGPITNNPNHFSQFLEAFGKLWKDGYNPFNPCTIVLGDDATWADYMKADLHELLDCDAIYMLPGWQESRGAKIEHDLALSLGMVEIFLKPTLVKADN